MGHFELKKMVQTTGKLELILATATALSSGYRK
jgi:hypothetical protein